MTGTRYLAALGRPEAPRTFSGISSHFFEAARRVGLLDEPLATATDRVRVRVGRILWNLEGLVTGRGTGGFQFTERFLERIWADAGDLKPDDVVINCFQLYPPSLLDHSDVRRWFFLDQTLTQLFDHYGNRSRLADGVAEDALALEREGYEAAEGIVVHSRWARDSLAKDYGIPVDKTHVVQPGANIPMDAYRRWERGQEAPQAPENPAIGSDSLQLVFVGRDWKRKGLDRLVAGIERAREQGASVELTVLGCKRNEVPTWVAATDGIRWEGFVDKSRELQRFLTLVSGADVGCLVSRAEAGGISLREFHALGLPTLLTDVGGAREHAIPEASIVLPADGGPETIAEPVHRLADDPEHRSELKLAAWPRRREALWPRAVERFREIWPYADEDPPERSTSDETAPTSHGAIQE